MSEGQSGNHRRPGKREKIPPVGLDRTPVVDAGQFSGRQPLALFIGGPALLIEGEYCLVVARWLETTNPAAYDYVMGFAQANQLRIQMDRRSGERALLREG